MDGLRKGRKIYVRKPEPNENNANILLIQKELLALTTMELKTLALYILNNHRKHI
jgi:hypothetical protein